MNWVEVQIIRTQLNTLNLYCLKQDLLQQNPSNKRSNIIQLINKNFNLIIVEQEQMQPIGLRYRE